MRISKPSNHTQRAGSTLSKNSHHKARKSLHTRDITYSKNLLTLLYEDNTMLVT